MPIREESFRIGCGRYIQGKGVISRLGEELSRLGSSPLVIGGKTALSKALDSLTPILEDNCNKYEIITHTGTCTKEDAERFVTLCREKGFNSIVGVGGGVICDLAKLTAKTGALPVINIPTSSATCACYTPLSVCYTAEGRNVGTAHFKTEVDSVLADTEIISTQPPRLFLAGVFDAIAKYIELRQRYSTDDEDYPLGLDYAYLMASRTFEILTSLMPKCLEDIERGEVSEAYERAIFASIAVTGVISGIARGSNQTAIAHKFYDSTRFLFPTETRPYLHGEIVGVGLLMQNHFNGVVRDNDFILSLMEKYNMPSSVEGMGVERTEEAFTLYYDKICQSSAVDGNDPEERARFKRSLEYLWGIE